MTRELGSPDSAVIISSCAFCGPWAGADRVYLERKRRTAARRSALAFFIRGRGLPLGLSGLLSRAGAVNMTYLLTHLL